MRSRLTGRQFPGKDAETLISQAVFIARERPNDLRVGTGEPRGASGISRQGQSRPGLRWSVRWDMGTEAFFADSLTAKSPDGFDDNLRGRSGGAAERERSATLRSSVRVGGG